MRTILPLETYYSNASKVNIAVHVRTGKGQEKGFSPASFLNVTMWLTKALRDRGKESSIHIFTEINGTSSARSTSYNVTFDEWTAFDEPHNLHFHIDVNRYVMFHHFVTADVVINSNSEFSEVATWANNDLKLYLNSMIACNNVGSLWNPCQGDNVANITATPAQLPHDYRCGGIGLNMTDVEAILDRSFGSLQST